MSDEITNVKVEDLIKMGNVTVTYSAVEDGKFGEQVRMLLKDKDDKTYGVNSTAKQIIKQAKDRTLKGCKVRFKAYTYENEYGVFTTYKMFVQSTPDSSD